MQTLLLIDGNAIMHRAFHALPPFKTKSAIPTNVIYGFFSMLYRAICDFNPKYLIVCFDTPQPTFRNKIFKYYQAQRPKIASDFKKQIPLVKQALDQAEITHVEQDGFEADDLIGTIASKLKKNGFLILILSGDRDILQLVSKNILVISPRVGLTDLKIYDEQEVKKKFGVHPSLMSDLKALMGDPSDNYPGAKGIGPKTAAKLLQRYQTIDNLYKHLAELDEKTRKILEDSYQNVLLARKLATINTQIPLNLDLKKAKFEKFNPKLKDFFHKLEINSLAKRFFEEKKNQTQKKRNRDNLLAQDQPGLF